MTFYGRKPSVGLSAGEERWLQATGSCNLRQLALFLGASTHLPPSHLNIQNKTIVCLLTKNIGGRVDVAYRRIGDGCRDCPPFELVTIFGGFCDDGVSSVLGG